MMKKLLLLWVCLICFMDGAWAQTPQYYNTNVGAGANTFPFANASTSRKVTWFIPANSLVNPTPVGPGNMITVVYFQTGNTANATYPIININLKNGTGTGLTGVSGGPCEAGLTTAFSGTNYFVSCTTGGWMSFTLSTPWAYNPALPLIVEVEHNNTSGSGPYVYQAVSIPGPGNGRQWANYQGATNTGVGTNQVNFGIDVIPATPCAGTPSANTVVTPTAGVCPNNSAYLTLATQYSVGGLNYQWYSSTVSPVGPFSPVPGGTIANLVTPTLNTQTYFTAVVTCTNSNGTTTTSAGTVSVQAVTTSSVPYFEGFEGIGNAGKLPNCSWAANNMNSTCFTYTNVQQQNRAPRTGNNYASFYYTPANNNMFWTNGIWMDAGKTYSVGLWYTTEYYTYPTYQLNLFVSPGQTTVNANMVATSGGAGSAASPAYKAFGNTYTVPTSGYYNVGINAISNGACCGYYLSWDDLEITAPCSLNPVNLTASSNVQTVCAGQSVNLTASGADTYQWSNGATGSAISVNPQYSTTYTVVGTVAATGCTAIAVQQINVNPSPVVSAIASPPTVCSGKPTTLLAFGGGTYLWNNNATSGNIVVSPTVTTSYTVIGTNSYGCSANGVVTVTVNPNPAVSINSSNSSNLACAEDETILSASGFGLITYQWSSATSLMMGNPVSVSPNFSTTYTLVATDANGCQGSASYQLNVASCVGLKDVTTTAGGIRLYPNPSKGEFIVETSAKTAFVVDVTDLTGRLLLTQSSQNEKLSIDLSHYSNGVYYVKVSTQDSYEVIKVIKQ